MKAKKKEIKLIDIGDLGLDWSAGNSELLELEPVPERSEAKMLSGSPREIAEQIVNVMKEEAVI